MGIVKRIVNRLLNYLRKYFLVLLPNAIFYLRKQVSLGKKVNAQQKLLLTGEGRILIGEECFFGCRLGGRNKNGVIEIQARSKDSVIQIGKNVATNNNIFICSVNSIVIGDDTLLGEGVTIMDFEAHGIHPDERRKMGTVGNVRIGNNVWVGNNVIILKNTEVGDNSIIAAGAVVSGKVPSNVIVGGVPAKVIRSI